MANSDYVPRGDPQFREWLRNFVTVLSPRAANLGLQASEVTGLADKREELEAAIADQIAKQAAAESAVRHKKDVRASAERLLRPLVRRITAHPTMTNDLRALLGLNIPSNGRTISRAGSDVPAVHLETRPGAVIVHFGTNPGNELLNGKPDWAKGCNIYRKKDGESEFSLLAFDTASPYTDYVSGPAISVAYKVAYRATRERDLGPSSEVVSVAAGG